MHQITKKVYYHDTDCGGVVYYANYLKYLEEGRTEFFTAKGIDLLRSGREGILFAVKSLGISYKRPARYGQVLTVKTRLAEVKSASLCFSQAIESEGVLLVSADTRLACIDKNFKAVLIPRELSMRIKNGL